MRFIKRKELANPATIEKDLKIIKTQWKKKRRKEAAQKALEAKINTPRTITRKKNLTDT